MKKNFLIMGLCLVSLTSLDGCKKKHNETESGINLAHDKAYWTNPAHKDELKKAMEACDAKFGTNPRDQACSLITDISSKNSWESALGGKHPSVTQSLSKGDNLW